MQPAPNQKSLWRRQIPTILGLSILVVALIAGLLFFGQGTGVFAPRATPQTTPKSIKVTNVTDSSFTISFLTDESTAGFVKYGTDAKTLNSQSSDDRDQLSGTVGSFPLHHVTIRGLQPNTTYYYVLGTGSQAQFDNQGSPFTLKTAARAGAPSAAKTIYGNVLNETGGPAEGSIVYVSADGVGEMSSLVKGSGSWAVPLSNARKTDGSGYAEITDDTTITLRAQGPSATEKAEVTTTVAQAQPVPAMTFGQTTQTTTTDTGTATGTEEAVSGTDLTSDSTASDSATDTSDTASDSAAVSSALNNALSQLASASGSGTTTSSSSASTTVDLQKGNGQVVTTDQPTITGKAVANVVVSITIHSTTEISQQISTDANGNFVLDIAQLQQQLEPGQHTVTYSYTDPTTGKTVPKTVTFTVNATSTQLASANTATTSPTATPFGSGNPYPLTTPVASNSTAASNSATAVSTTSATTKGGIRSSQPASGSGIPVSGSVGTTLALVIGGLFFTITGAWSYWVSQQLQHEAHSEDEY